MSEPTYRIELTHDPASGAAVCWDAHIYRITDPDYFIMHVYGASREAAFDLAQQWVKAKASTPEPPSTVFLTEDGDIHDPHDKNAPHDFEGVLAGTADRPCTRCGLPDRHPIHASAA